jgi:polyhydroxyalkanoate synthesis regulator phasin
MPAKKDKAESPEAQSERFRKAVRDLVDAGELNSTEAQEAFEKLIDLISDNSK